jgi:hypothetical protein
MSKRPKSQGIRLNRLFVNFKKLAKSPLERENSCYFAVDKHKEVWALRCRNKCGGFESDVAKKLKRLGIQNLGLNGCSLERSMNYTS